MTIDRAIEILDPEHREHYDGMDEVNEACRMGMEALERGRNAAPVVRCRDCASFEEIGKYPTNMPEPRGGTSFGYCYHWEYEQGMSPNEVDGNDFCSYGRIREDENGRT